MACARLGDRCDTDHRGDTSQFPSDAFSQGHRALSALSRTGKERGARDFMTLIGPRKLHLSARSELITDIHNITLHLLYPPA